MRHLIYLSLFSIAFCAFSCVPEIDQQKSDDEEIQNYLQENNLTAESTDSGLHYIITQIGNDTFPESGDSVIVNYRGYYTDGWEFDNGAEIKFNLNDVIQGWQEGMQKISENGSGIILIPSILGYANTPPAGVRTDAVLVFDVDLVDVIKN